MNNIDKTAKIINSQISHEVCIYRNAFIDSTVLGEKSSIGDDTTIVRCQIGKSVIINRRSYLNDTILGDYSYAGINTTINWSCIGKFCSIGRNVDIGGFNHNYEKVTTLPLFRLEQMIASDKKLRTSNINAESYCMIGNDVWIAAGVNVLHKVSIGDGAVIGAGSVVTKDVPPFAVVAGNPAKILKFRFSENHIKNLLKIKWWNWPDEIILKNIKWMVQEELSDTTINRLWEIKKYYHI